VTKGDSLKNYGGICGGCYGKLMEDKRSDCNVALCAPCLVCTLMVLRAVDPRILLMEDSRKRSGASPDDFTKWEVAKIVKTSSQVEKKNVNRVCEEKYRNDQEQ